MTNMMTQGKIPCTVNDETHSISSQGNTAAEPDTCVISQQDEEGGQATEKKSFLNGPYTQREYAFVVCSGVLLAFNSGYVNGTCLSGFVTASGRQQAAMSVTGFYTRSALALAEGDYDYFRFFVCVVLSFFGGACLSGIMTPYPTPWRIEPTYGPTFLVGAAFLVGSSVFSAVERNGNGIFYLASAASGIQNGLSSTYSGNLIRSTGYTSAITDVSIFTAQLCRGNKKNTWRLVVLLCFLTAFWIGGIVSFYATQKFTSYSLLFNAGLFLLIGVSLIAFVTQQHQVSVKQAIFGTWQWKQSLEKLQATFAEGASAAFMTRSQKLDRIFDKIDMDQSGDIDRDELFLALREAGIPITKKNSRNMLKYADTDGDGVISREEWRAIALLCQHAGNQAAA